MKERNKISSMKGNWGPRKEYAGKVSGKNGNGGGLKKDGGACVRYDTKGPIESDRL